MNEETLQNCYVDAAAILEVGISIKVGVAQLQKDYDLSDNQVEMLEGVLEGWAYDADPEFTTLEREVKQILSPIGKCVICGRDAYSVVEGTLCCHTEGCVSEILDARANELRESHMTPDEEFEVEE